MKRARVWLRVSTEKQDEEQQLSACQRRIGYGDRGEPWAFDVATGVYRAHAVSGDDLAHPLRGQVMADAKAGEFDVLVVWALDRWTRGGVLALLQDREQFARARVELVSVQEEWASNDLLLAIAAWQGQQELLRRRERTKMAVNHRRALIRSQGYFVSKTGVKRFALGRARIPVPEAAVALALAAREAGHGWRRAAAAVAAAGLGTFDHATLMRACKRVGEKEPGRAA